MITLEQFRATRRRIDDLAAETGGEYWDDDGEIVVKPAYVYEGLLAIEIEVDGRLYLILNRDEDIGDESMLSQFEERLYRWAVDEGYFDNVEDVAVVIAQDQRENKQ